MWRHVLADHFEDPTLHTCGGEELRTAARALYADTRAADAHHWRHQLVALVERVLREAARAT